MLTCRAVESIMDLLACRPLMLKALSNSVFGYIVRSLFIHLDDSNMDLSKAVYSSLKKAAIAGGGAFDVEVDAAAEKSLQPDLVRSLLRSPVVDDTFAMYLKYPQTISSPSVGQLLLGDGDPSLYKKPIGFVEMTDEIEYKVSLNMMKVGEGVLTIGMNHEALLDTGSNYMYVPQLYINHLVNEITTQASTSAGRQVPINFDQSRKSWVFDCANFNYMPAIVFGFGPNGAVPLMFSP
ncbi:HEAT repeat-containing protein 2 [Perkinsus chesapeaki]|uniref:HEAT repeat-containing protein 2 n=1 Tax=Perkinsus chesapeaki TaxID=330153 RepID=A0A7J6LZF0_PERCH|nr:HEAT repeat-containing protein 2 [Perkinsus chesapeaki]